ncbi:MAG: VWA domain-containing protein [Acidobacteriota bacterium]
MTKMISISGSPIGPNKARTLIRGSLRPRGAALGLILALTSTGSGAGRDSPPQRPLFAAGVTEVAVYATVTGADGRPVKGLVAEDFVLLEDDVPQVITTFAGGEFPAAVGLAIDRSFSMRGTPLTLARTAGRAFIGALRPDDRAMLISISGEVEVLAPLSRDKGPVLDALAGLDAWSTTSLNDALIRALDLLERETGRRAVVLLSDGADRYSAASDADVVARGRRSAVIVYPVAIGPVRPAFFVEIATVTGGRSFHVRDPKDLQPTLQAIVADLRDQYLLGYAPTRPPGDAAEWRAITVHAKRPELRVRARSGYSIK